MGDGITIPLDVDDTKARAKVGRLKRDAADAGREYGKAGRQAARAAGPAGRTFGRAVGGFENGVGAGLVGLGLAAAGVGINAFLARDAERVTAAKEREQRVQGREAMARTVIEKTDQRAAGGANFIEAARRMISRGASNSDIQAGFKTGKSMGITTSEALDAMDVSSETGVSEKDIMIGMSTGIFGNDASHIADTIIKNNGLRNAIAAKKGITSEQAFGVISNALNPDNAVNVNRAATAQNPVMESQLSDLFSGKTANVLEQGARDEMDPATALMIKAAKAADDTVRQLRAAADAQGVIAATLSEMGRVIGLSEGSAQRALIKGADAAGGQ